MRVNRGNHLAAPPASTLKLKHVRSSTENNRSLMMCSGAGKHLIFNKNGGKEIQLPEKKTNEPREARFKEASFGLNQK